MVGLPIKTIMFIYKLNKMRKYLISSLIIFNVICSCSYNKKKTPDIKVLSYHKIINDFQRNFFSRNSSFRINLFDKELKKINGISSSGITLIKVNYKCKIYSNLDENTEIKLKSQSKNLIIIETLTPNTFIFITKDAEVIKYDFFCTPINYILELKIKVIELYQQYI